METYYSNKLAEQSYMIGHLQIAVKYLAQIIITTSDADYLKKIAQDAIDELENLEEKAKNNVEIINQKIALMSTEEGR